MYADNDSLTSYINTWKNLLDGCDEGSNFPLALK
jgi:hypothetical protein